MNEGVKTSARTSYGDRGGFPLTIGLCL